MMVEDVLNPRRIREKAPYRKSMSLTEDDLTRASELERIFNNRFESEAPFNFSKTISKALEIAIRDVLQPANQSSPGAVQQDLTGLPADQRVLQARELRKNELLNVKQSGTGNQSGTQKFTTPGKPKRFQKKKRGF